MTTKQAMLETAAVNSRKIRGPYYSPSPYEEACNLVRHFAGDVRRCLDFAAGCIDDAGARGYWVQVAQQLVGALS